MILLVDANNVLHVEGVLPLPVAGIDLIGLCHLARGSRYREHALWMACDGKPAGPPRAAHPQHGPAGSRFVGHLDHHAGAHILHPDRGASADDVMLQILRTTSAAQSILVVTSDHRVQREASRRGATAMDSAPWLEQLAQDMARHPQRRREGRPTEPLTPEAVEEWLKYFREEP